MRVYIVEDVKDTRKLIIQLLKEYCPQVSVEGFADNLADAEAQILETDPDLLLLDIKLGNETVFDLLKKFREVYKTRIFSIIISAYNDFANAREAIQYGVIDFLAKPIDPQELKKAVENAAEKLKESRSPVFASPDDQLARENKLPVRLPNNRFLFLGLEEIQYIEASSNTCTFFLQEDKTIRSIDSLAFFKSHPFVQRRFIPISKSVLVNPQHLKYFDHRNNELTLKSGIKLQASRRGGKELFDEIRKNQ